MKRLRKGAALLFFVAWLGTVTLFIGKLAELPFHANWLLLMGLAALFAWGAICLSRIPLPQGLTLTHFRPLRLNLTRRSLVFVLLGLGLSLVSLGLHIRFDFSAPTITTDIATVSYVMGLLTLSIGVFMLGSQPRTKGIRLTRWELVGLILFLFIGVLIRIYRITAVGHLPEDSLWMNQAFLVLNRTLRSPFLFIGDLSTNMPVYAVALAYIATHSMSLAVRLPSVVYALLFHVALFFLAKETLGKKVAFWALILATFSIWDVHTSRLAWHNLTTNPVLITGILLFLVRALKYHNVSDMYLCGIVCGIAFNLLYIPAMMVGIVVVFYWAYSLLSVADGKEQIFTHLKHAAELFVVFFLSYLLVIGPTIVKIFRYPQTLSRHANFIKQNVQLSNQTNSRVSYYVLQFSNALSAFGYSPDHYRSDGPWGPALNPAMVFFYHVGLAGALASIGAVAFPLFFLTWLTLYVPVVVLYITGSVWRLIVFSPLVFLFAAYGIHLCVIVLMALAPRRLVRVAAWGIPVFVIGVLGYFIRQEFAKYYYLRTNEAQNHIFQLCKAAEETVASLSPTYIFVDDTWCGRTLATVFTGRIPVLDYATVTPLQVENLPRGSVLLKTQSRQVLGQSSDEPADFELFHQFSKYRTIQDEKADQQVDIYTVQQVPTKKED